MAIVQCICVQHYDAFHVTNSLIIVVVRDSGAANAVWCVWQQTGGCWSVAVMHAMY